MLSSKTFALVYITKIVRSDYAGAVFNPEKYFYLNFHKTVLIRLVQIGQQYLRVSMSI